MKLGTVLPCLLVMIGTASIAAAQNPFVGTWKLNPAKSSLAGTTIKFGLAADDATELDADGSSYSFRVDGKAYRMASGDVAQWTQRDSATWMTTYRTPAGKLLSTETWTLSPDGKTLTAVSAGTQPDGQAYSDKTAYTRTAGGGGLMESLMGSWKSTAVAVGRPEEMIIAPYGLGGLSFKFPFRKASFLAVYGGKQVVPSGPDIPPALTIALERVGPSGFRLIRRLSGEVTYSAVYKVSADGKTITQTGNARGNPSQTTVWDKQ